MALPNLKKFVRHGRLGRTILYLKELQSKDSECSPQKDKMGYEVSNSSNLN
jgi:hypothetical protein